MRKEILAILVVLSAIQLGMAQTKSVDIELSDFEFDSPHYRQDVLKKINVYNYLSEHESEGINVRELLLGYCIDHGTIVSSTNNKKESKTKNESIASLISHSFGRVIYCITEINQNGDIFYRATYSANLKILIDEGVLRRL